VAALPESPDGAGVADWSGMRGVLTLGVLLALLLIVAQRALATEAVLHSFTGSPDGASPTGGTLLFDKEGNLYGTTLYGGAYGADHKGGTVWELTPSGTLTVLHNFELNEIDGYGSDAGVVMDEKGNFYGTTYYGGTYGSGTVYEVNRDSWPLPPVYSSH
jgi:uncharacterized repeat protein (TIGR03803 family)